MLLTATGKHFIPSALDFLLVPLVNLLSLLVFNSFFNKEVILAYALNDLPVQFILLLFDVNCNCLV